MDDRGRPQPLGLGSLRQGLETPNYLFTTQKLPVLPTGPSSPREEAMPLPPKRTPLITPAHLLRDNLNDTLHSPRMRIFSDRRPGPANIWRTMAMEQNEQVHGSRAYW